MNDRIRRLGTLLRQVSAAAKAAGTGIDAALDQVAAIQKYYASGGLLGIVGNLDRVRTALETIRPRPMSLAGTADSLARQILSITGETTPDQVIAILTPVAADLARTATGTPELDRALADIQALTHEVLAGGSPEHLIGKVQTVRDTLAPARTALHAAHAIATEEIELARQAGDSGPGGASSAGPAAGRVESASIYTPEHLARVVDHLGRLDHAPQNDAMVDGIRQAMAAGRPLSEGEVNFLRHEITEAELMDGGMPYDDAHRRALQTHPLMRNYTPDVINRYPELFNNNWRRAWGMEPR